MLLTVRMLRFSPKTALLLLAELLGVGLWLVNAAYVPLLAQDTSAPALDVANAGAQTPLTPYLAFWRDPGGELTLNEAAAPENSDRFVPFGASLPNFGLTSDAVWVRLMLANSSTSARSMILHLDAPTTSFVDFYANTPSTGQPAVITGARRPYATRPLPGRAFAFPITIPPGETSAYYWRLQTDFPVTLAFALWQPQAFTAAAYRDEIQWGTVFGMLLLMATYNLLLYLTLREGQYLMLVAFGLLVFVSSSFSGGYASRWLPPALADAYSLFLAVSMALVIAAFVLVSLTFLELRRSLRPAYRILVGGLAAVAAAVLLAAGGGYRAAYALMFGVLLVMLLCIFAATIIRVRQGSRLALFLLLGQVTAIVFGIVQSLSTLGFGPKLPVLPLLVPSNSLFLLVLMSLALADRINGLRKEADRANAALTASEQRLTSYLDALPFNIQVHDPQLKPLYINAAIRKSGGVQREGWYEEQYKVWLQEYPVVVSGTGEPYPIEKLPLMRAAGGEWAHADDVAINMPRGQVVIEAWAVPLRDEAGSITAIVSAFQDISHRRAIETELANYRETLEQRVAQRTSELAARVSELTAINEVGRQVARISDLQGTLEDVVQILTDVFQDAGAAIGLFDHKQQTMRIAAIADWGARGLGRLAGQSFACDFTAGRWAQQQSPKLFTGPEQILGLPPAVHATLRELGISSVLAAPLVTRDQHLGALVLFSPDASRTFSAEELRVAQTLAGQVATAIDTVRLIEEAQRQRDVAEALRRTATALSRNLDQQNVLGTILEQLDQVFACGGAAVALVEGNQLVTAAAQGLSAGCIGRHAPLNGTGADLTVLRTRKPVLVEDTHSSAEVVCCADSLPIRSWLGAPLISGDEAIGVLSLDSVTPQSFDQAHADLLATFADQAAIAVANARLYAQAQIAAVAGERNRLARDLHDAVTQTIFSASLVATALPGRLPDLPPAAQADLDMLQVLTKGALAEMRTLLLELRPEHLAEAPLEMLLPQLGQAFSGRTGVPVHVDAAGDSSYAPPYAVKIGFYRVAQEALNNVAKHANAACVTIRCSIRQGSIRLAVIDDGRGFDPQVMAPEKLGITIMRERAAAIGAQLTLDSEPGLGTHLFMVWSDEHSTQTA